MASPPLFRYAVGMVLGVGLVAASLTFAPTAAQAAVVTATIDGVTYTADDSDIGAGATATAYDNSSPIVTIPLTVNLSGVDYAVTAIGDAAFRTMTLDTVTIGGNVTTIGHFAFNDSGIDTLVLGTALTTIGDGAFAYNSLGAVTIPDGVTSIGGNAFYSADITTLTLGAGLTTILSGAFGANTLGSVTIPDSVTFLGSSAFLNSGVTALALGSGLTTIEHDTFRGNSITDLTIPDNVTTISYDAFSGTFGGVGIQTLTLGTGVTTIGSFAFRYNSISEVTIPDSVTTIGIAAFYGAGLTTLTLGTGVTIIGVGAFESNDLATVTIPPGVTAIASSAFADNPSLASVKLTGAAPTITATSFGDPAGKIVRYPSLQAGYTSPWFGYTTQPYATVAFDAGGGIPAPGDQDVDLGDAVTEPADPSRPGFVFAGWYTDASFTTPYDFAGAVTGDLTLYAQFAADDDGILPATGFPVSSTAISLACLVLAAGAALLLGSRRRTRLASLSRSGR